MHANIPEAACDIFFFFSTEDTYDLFSRSKCFPSIKKPFFFPAQPAELAVLFLFFLVGVSFFICTSANSLPGKMQVSALDEGSVLLKRHLCLVFNIQFIFARLNIKKSNCSMSFLKPTPNFEGLNFQVRYMCNCCKRVHV